MLQKILFQINAVLLNFLFIKESWGKKWYKTVFNIDYALGSSQRVCCLLCLFKRIWPSPCKQSECNFDYPWKWSKVVKHKPHYPSFMAKMLWF